MSCNYRGFHQVVFLIVMIFLLGSVAAYAQTAPVVTNVVATQRENSFIVDVTYDLADAVYDSVWVRLYFSPDGGDTWPVLCTAVSGDVGEYVMVGAGRSIEWNAVVDYPGEILSTCTMRVTASNTGIRPIFDGFWKSDLDGTNEFAINYTDTVPYATPFRLRWQASAPSIVGMDPVELALIDTVYPYDDGIMGFKYFIPNDNCIPTFEDCWQPRRFNEATGDSFSFWGQATTLDFHNNDSGVGVFREILPSGVLELRVNTVDVYNLEATDYQQYHPIVVNYDPQTIMLNGETDWAHPEDPQVYPYYIQLNDPTEERHPFQDGDRIPDRTYVVFKALSRDDPRDGIIDGNFKMGFTGFMQGVRQNLLGGVFSFGTEASTLNYAPTWDLGIDGWYADTLGFMTGPNTEFTMNMQGVDEAGRRDGTPAELSFQVGYPPCLQCVEILAKSNETSGWTPDVACVDDPATHPCFQETAMMRVVQYPVPGDGNLEFQNPVVMLVDKSNYSVRVELSNVGFEQTHYSIDANRYTMSVLLHGKDDPREAWLEGVRRTLGWMYQVDYNCDPFNSIQDGGGNDDISEPTWGETNGDDGLMVEPTSGLWRLEVDVVVPRNLFSGGDTYNLLLLYTVAGQDPEIAAAIYEATTRQFGAGSVRAITLDQTSCGALPMRPGRYIYFKGVRPPDVDLFASQTWRDCNLFVPDIKGDLSLSHGAMRSLDGVPVTKYFQIVVETSSGDFICELGK